MKSTAGKWAVGLNAGAVMANRYLHLVRHGQYFNQKDHPKFGQLTPLGRYQARRAGKRLSELKVNRVYSSTMTRAEETGEIILKQLGRVKSESCDLLIEGLPTLPPELAKQRDAKASKMKRTRERLDKAFDKYFFPHDGRTDRHEVLSCHGNLIRYLLTRVLEVPKDRWMKFDILQGSISTVCISDSGKMNILSYGEVGHIPLEKRTFL